MTRVTYYRILIILCMVGGITPFATDLYLPVIPAIAQALHTSVTHMQLTVSVFFAGFALGQLVYGPLADAFGRKRTILLGATIFLLATIGCIFANSFAMFFTMRAVQALGGAAGAVVINAVMRDLFQGVDFVKALSFTMLTITLAPLIAPTLGGLLAGLGWQFIFGVLAIIALTVILVVTFGLPETLDPTLRQSFRPKTVMHNYLEVLKNKRVLGAILAQTIHVAGGFAFISGSPFVYMKVYGVSPQVFGLLFAINVSCILIVTFLTTKLAQKIPVIKLLKMGLLISVCGGTVLLFSACFHFASVFSIVLPVIGYMCVMGLIGATSTTYVLGFYREKSGTASACIGALRFGLGGGVGIILNLYPATSAVPLAITMFSCGIVANIAFYALRRSALHEIQQRYQNK